MAFLAAVGTVAMLAAALRTSSVPVREFRERAGSFTHASFWRTVPFAVTDYIDRYVLFAAVRSGLDAFGRLLSGREDFSRRCPAVEDARQGSPDPPRRVGRPN